jgi:hypothetical protein
LEARIAYWLPVMAPALLVTVASVPAITPVMPMMLPELVTSEGASHFDATEMPSAILLSLTETQARIN